jgi:hemerythrin-like domain-containing protein
MSNCPFEKMQKEHAQVEKGLRDLEKVLNVAEAYGLAVFEKEHHKLQHIRQLIQHELGVHLQKEEDVLFPCLIQNNPEARSIIQGLISDHEDLKHLSEALVQAIQTEHLEHLIEAGDEFLERMSLNISREEAYYNEVSAEDLPPSMYQTLNHLLNQVTQRWVGVEMF